MLEAPLDDSASVRVLREFDDAPTEDFDKVEVGRSHNFKHFLDNLNGS